MASNIEIQKKCEWCGTIFTAHKITTAYCSHRCANLAYKNRVRKTNSRIPLETRCRIKTQFWKRVLNPTEVAAFLGVGRTSIYRYIKNAKIKAVRFDGKTLVRRSDIDKMFDYIIASNNENKPKEKTPISDFYTTAEVKEKYGIKDSWIFHIAKEHNIPRTFHRGKTYWSKNILMITLQRKLLILKSRNGIAHKTYKRSSAWRWRPSILSYQRMPFPKRKSASWYTTPRSMWTLPRSHSSRRAQILHHCRSDGAIQSDTGSTLPLCEIP